MAMRRPEPGFWTYGDLEALPDDGRRYEIVEGVLHQMTGPTWEHATALRNLIVLLLPAFAAARARWFPAPLDVFFPGADPVQPDLLAILPGNPGRGVRRGFEGVPDLVVEVLSRSTRGHDMLTKRSLYARAGVREYWLVDPESRTIEVLTLGQNALQSVLVAAGDEVVRSALFPDVAFPASAVFADPAE